LSEENRLTPDIWNHIFDTAALLEWIDKWKKGEIVHVDILACGLVKKVLDVFR
jgi:hypothetical protein